MHAAAEAAGVTLWSWNVDNDRITLDKRALSLWGIPDAEGITFEKLSARIHPADLDKVRAAFSATRQINGPYETDFRIMHESGVRWISARGTGGINGVDGPIVYGVFLDVSVRKEAEEARELVTGEMHHRIKNLFALASALAGISSRATKTKEEMIADLKARLQALSSSHDLIRPGFHAQAKAAKLADIFAVVLKPYMEDGPIANHLAIDVPAVLVGEKSGTSLAMVIHELATDSMKYGALSTGTGKLFVSGFQRDGEIEIVWTETGGPVVERPSGRPGFGSQLVTASVCGQLGGAIKVDWPPGGTW